MPHVHENQILALSANELPARTASLEFGGSTYIEANAAAPAAVFSPSAITTAELGVRVCHPDNCAPLLEISENGDYADTGPQLAGLKPLGQIRDSFILAVDHDGLWIVDQHVAHERVLFEKVLKHRNADRVEQQRMLMPMIVELTPGQQIVFAEISEELRRNGFEVELFGSRTIAVKGAPAGIEASDIERMLHELLDQFEREQQMENLEAVQHRIAASIACHAAIKVNTPLDQNKMEWLLRELAKTECPMSCPHGRPVVLRYSLKEIQRAFKRI